MSDLVPHKRTISHSGRLRWLNADPETIFFDPGNPARIRFTDGGLGVATCLGCHDAPCMELTEAELRIAGALNSFPGNPSVEVCPTEAIAWDEAGEVPTIDPNLCMGCGLCAIRCPYGAITLGPTGVAVVEGDDPARITNTTTTAIGPHVMTPRAGILGPPTARFMRAMPEILAELSDTEGTLLARNMLLASGVAASMRRKGDTNVRMDGVFRTQTNQTGVIEFEAGVAVLETPRALLEDVAVLHRRFDVPVAAIVPLSLIGALPNIRSEYYRVMDDIFSVLNIQCRTVTLGALCVLAWRFANLARIDGDLFIPMGRATDLHSSLAQLIPDLPLTEPYPGAYRPPK